MARVAAQARDCAVCGNVGTAEVCAICADPRRATGEICVVEDVADLWAMERGGAFKGRYHVLGGTLSALDAVGPDDLRIPALVERIRDGGITEVILALNATVDGQTTAHYIADAIEAEGGGVAVTSLAQGVPVGGELDYLDDGTIDARRSGRGAGSEPQAARRQGGPGLSSMARAKVPLPHQAPAGAGPCDPCGTADQTAAASASAIAEDAKTRAAPPGGPDPRPPGEEQPEEPREEGERRSRRATSSPPAAGSR